MNLFVQVRFLGIASAIAGIVLSEASPAQAAFTYAGGSLNAAETYDGTGADSGINPHTFGTTGSNNYIGSGGTGSLTVLGGTLTMIGNDVKIGRNNNPSDGTITISGGVLNISQTNQWGGGVGVAGNNTNVVSGTVNVAAGAGLDWFLSGSNEQRFVVGSGGSNTTGTLNLNGGTFTIRLDAAQAITDATAGFRVGSGGAGDGFINLNSGTLRTSGNLPLALGGSWTTFTTTPTFNEAGLNAGIGKMSIVDGAFEQTGTSLFAVGTDDFIDFVTGGVGYLSILNWTQPQFEMLVANGRITVDGSAASASDFAFSTDGAQGVYQLVPEPASVALMVLGSILLLHRRSA